jgi:hypothetical protein
MGVKLPVLITWKLIFQDFGCRGLVWDERLPGDLGTRWSNSVKFLPDLLHIHIPRWVGPGKRKLRNPRLLRRIRGGGLGCALHPFNPQYENLGADCMQ